MKVLMYLFALITKKNNILLKNVRLLLCTKNVGICLFMKKDFSFCSIIKHQTIRMN